MIDLCYGNFIWIKNVLNISRISHCALFARMSACAFWQKRFLPSEKVQKTSKVAWIGTISPFITKCLHHLVRGIVVLVVEDSCWESRHFKRLWERPFCSSLHPWWALRLLAISSSQSLQRKCTLFEKTLFFSFFKRSVSSRFAFVYISLYN